MVAIPKPTVQTQLDLTHVAVTLALVETAKPALVGSSYIYICIYIY